MPYSELPQGTSSSMAIVLVVLTLTAGYGAPTNMEAIRTARASAHLAFCFVIGAMLLIIIAG